jgi:hypothetical protein
MSQQRGRMYETDRHSHFSVINKSNSGAVDCTRIGIRHSSEANAKVLGRTVADAEDPDRKREAEKTGKQPSF